MRLRIGDGSSRLDFRYAADHRSVPVIVPPAPECCFQKLKSQSFHEPCGLRPERQWQPRTGIRFVACTLAGSAHQRRDCTDHYAST